MLIKTSEMVWNFLAQLHLSSSGQLPRASRVTTHIQVTWKLLALELSNSIIDSLVDYSECDSSFYIQQPAGYRSSIACVFRCRPSNGLRHREICRERLQHKISASLTITHLQRKISVKGTRTLIMDDTALIHMCKQTLPTLNNISKIRGANTFSFNQVDGWFIWSGAPCSCHDGCCTAALGFCCCCVASQPCRSWSWAWYPTPLSIGSYSVSDGARCRTAPPCWWYYATRCSRFYSVTRCSLWCLISRCCFRSLRIVRCSFLSQYLCSQGVCPRATCIFARSCYWKSEALAQDTGLLSKQAARVAKGCCARCTRSC